MALDLRELARVERARLAEDAAGHAQLAHVVQQAADREVAQRRGRQAQLLADRHGEHRHAAGVLLGRAVLGGEVDHQRAHARAEERLLGADELGGGEVADERPRGAAVAQVEHGGDRDQHDAQQLEAWPK